jgi:two-component system cell cycle sensor histidine kinase/response regulator CckA
VIVGGSTALAAEVSDALAARAQDVVLVHGLEDAVGCLSECHRAVVVLVDPSAEDPAHRIAALRRTCEGHIGVMVVAYGDSLRAWSTTPGLHPFEWCDAASGAQGWLARFDALVHRTGVGDGEFRELVRELEQARRMESVGRLAGGISHDFNNLLTSIVGNVDLLGLRGIELPELSELRTAVDRATELTRQLLAFGRGEESEPQAVDLDAAISESARLFARLIGEHVDVRVVRGPGLWRVRVAPGQMQQVLMNLVINARDAMPEGGTLTLRTRNVVLEGASEDGGAGRVPAGEYVQLTVEDTGHGMDAGTLARIGEPYFTTKPEGKGTGLGLSTVIGIVRRAGGDLVVDSLVGAGTRVRLWLPRTRRPGQTGRHARVATARPRASGTVLLVEDDDLVRSFAARTLTGAGYDVIERGDPTDALDVWAAHSGSICALVTDVIMPRMSGPAVAKRLRGTTPNLPVVYISGHPDSDSHFGGAAERDEVLAKPFSADALLDRVARAIAPPA